MSWDGTGRARAAMTGEDREEVCRTLPPGATAYLSWFESEAAPGRMAYWASIDHDGQRARAEGTSPVWAYRHALRALLDGAAA